MSLNPNHHGYIEKALIANCALILDEFSETYVEEIRDSIFRQGQKPGANGLQKQAWFRSVAQGTSAIREQANKNRPNRRFIAWKTGKPFEAQNLFFRTVDTSRLLPAALADFRIQWYAPKGIWDWLDSKKAREEIPFDGRKGLQMYALSCFVCFNFCPFLPPVTEDCANRCTSSSFCVICMILGVAIFPSFLLIGMQTIWIARLITGLN